VTLLKDQLGVADHPASIGSAILEDDQRRRAMTYNGWRNYETWAVGMWLDGNYTGEATALEALDVVRAASDDYDASNVDKGIWTEDQARVYAVEAALKSYFEESLPDLGASIEQDLLNAATSEINWRELAESRLDG
jgi:hypothetical protein